MCLNGRKWGDYELFWLNRQKQIRGKYGNDNYIHGMNYQNLTKLADSECLLSNHTHMGFYCVVLLWSVVLSYQNKYIETNSDKDIILNAYWFEQ